MGGFDDLRDYGVPTDHRMFSIEICLTHLTELISEQKISDSEIINSMKFIKELLFMDKDKLPQMSKKLYQMMAEFSVNDETN